MAVRKRSRGWIRLALIASACAGSVAAGGCSSQFASTNAIDSGITLTTPFGSAAFHFNAGLPASDNTAAKALATTTQNSP